MRRQVWDVLSLTQWVKQKGPWGPTQRRELNSKHPVCPFQTGDTQRMRPVRPPSLASPLAFRAWGASGKMLTGSLPYHLPLSSDLSPWHAV